MLQAGQITRACAVGIFFWFVAAMTVRAGGSLFGGWGSAGMFAAAVPLLWVAVLIIRKLARLQASQLVAGCALATGAAAFCDGIALTWFRPMYGTDSDQIVLGAAWILWGAGMALVLAYVEAERRG